MFTLYFFNFFIGSCLASHACLLFDRYYSENFIFSRSYCSNCKSIISIIDEIPIISFLLLRGKCRYCQNNIPADLLFFEFLGGITFLHLNVFDISLLPKFIFNFYLLLIAIFDYHDGEFPILFFFPLLISSTFYHHSFSIYDIYQFISIASLLLLFTIYKQIGSGDFYIYLFLCYTQKPTRTNLIFLFASLLTIIHYLIEKRKVDQFHFIPYIFFCFTLFNLN